jgi:hypothetical protein
MTLKELQKMIKEELDSFVQNENVDEMSDKMNEVDVDVDTEAGDVDAEGGDDSGAEDMLRNIYDMLKDKFEGEEDMGDMGDEEAPEDVEETYMDENMDEGDEDKMEELANHGVGKSAKNSSGANAGYTPAKTTTGDKKLHEEKSQLQERFQRLANIIK